MIFPAINIIKSELNNNSIPIPTELANIGDIISGTINTPPVNVIISLINIEENRISRDPQNFVRVDNNLIKKNPAVHLNLTLLFTTTRNGNGYQLGLQDIQDVIQFFQHKDVFDHTNTPGLDAGIEKLIFEMVSLNLEQLNHLWAILGGRYQPSVLYRVRMVTIDSVSDQMGSLIKEVETNYIK